MQVIVEFAEGHLRGRVISIGPRTIRKFGRGQGAFKLTTDDYACLLTSYDATLGTVVNDQAVLFTLLHDGDRICLGDTEFHVHIQGDLPHRSELAKKGTELAPVQNGLLPSSNTMEFTVDRGRSSFTTCRGSCDQIAPVDLADRLGQIYPLHLIVSFQRASRPLPPRIDELDFLFDWLDQPAAAEFSPVLVTASVDEQWRDYLRQCWGKDAIVALFTTWAKSDLLSHLRNAICPMPSIGREKRQILAYYLPSIVETLVYQLDEEYATEFLAGIEFVLIESSTDSGRWITFGREELVSSLTTSGLRQVTSQDQALA